MEFAGWDELGVRNVRLLKNVCTPFSHSIGILERIITLLVDALESAMNTGSGNVHKVGAERDSGEMK